MFQVTAHKNDSEHWDFNKKTEPKYVFSVDSPLASILKKIGDNDEEAEYAYRYGRLTNTIDFNNKYSNASTNHQFQDLLDQRVYSPKDDRFIKKAEQIIEYYQTEFAIKTLEGIKLSPWEKSCVDIIKKKELTEKEIHFLAKLDELYDNHQHFNWLTADFPSVEHNEIIEKNIHSNTGFDIQKMVNINIHLLDSRRSPLKGFHTTYIFRTENNEIIDYSFRDRQQVSLFNTLLDTGVQLCVSGNYGFRKIYSRGFIYMHLHDLLHFEVVK